VGTRELTGKKVASRKNSNSVPFSAKFKKEYSYIFNPLILYGMHRDSPLPKAI